MKTSTQFFLSLFLSFLWLYPTGAQAAESTAEIGGLKYVLITGEEGANNIATIVGYTGDGVADPLNISATVKKGEVTYNVIAIGAGAFSGTTLTSVTFAEGLTSIGANAFKDCEKLTSVEFPSSLVQIGAEAFEGAVGLTSAKLEDGSNLTTIGDNAFNGCTGLATVVLNKATNLTKIGDGAFAGADLTSVTLTEVTSLETIGAGAFAGSKLTSLDFELAGATVLKTIGAGAFADSEKLTSVKLPVSLDSIGEGAFAGSTKLTSVELNKGTVSGGKLLPGASETSLRSIGKDAFKGCTALETVVFRSATSLVSVEESAFNGCEKLATIWISDATSLTEIGDSAFAGIAMAKLDLTVGGTGEDAGAGATGLTKIGKGAFAGSGLTSVVFPTSLVEIGAGAFAGSTELKSATLADGENLTTIGKDAFKGCTNLDNVVLTGAAKLTTIGAGAFQGTDLTSVALTGVTSLKSIGDSAFAGSKLTSLDFELAEAKGLKEIGKGAFADSEELLSVKLPASLDNIGEGAFAGSKKLASVTLTSPVPPKVGEGAFDDIAESPKFEVGGEAFLGDYQDAPAWAGNFPPVYIDAETGLKFYIVEGEDNKKTAIVSGYGGEIKGGLGLTIPAEFTVTIPAEDEEGEDEKVTYPVTAIGDGAFAGLTELTEVTFAEVTAEDGLTIGVKAFAGTGLVKVSFPKGLTEIGDSAFKESKDLKEVAVPAVGEDEVATLGKGVFAGIYEGYVFTCPADDFAMYSAAKGWQDFFKNNTDGAAYGFTFEVDTPEEGTATVATIMEVTKTDGELTIPERVTDKGKAYDVVAIKKEAFKDVEDKLTVTFLSATPPDIDPEDGEVEAIKNENIKFIPPAEALFAYQTSVWWPYVELPVYAFTFTTTEKEVEVPAEEEKGEEETETKEPQTKIVRTATVTGVNYTYTGQEQVGKVTAITIPEVVIFEGKAYTIAAIAAEAFAGCINLTKFHLESAIPPVLSTDVFKGVDTDKVTFTAGSTAYTDDAAVRAFYESNEHWKRYFPKKEDSKPEEGNSGGSDGGNGGGTGGGGSTSGSFRVTFHTGTGTSQTTIAKGDTIPADIVPVLEEREGYTLFWYAGSDASNIWDFSTPVTAVLDLYPVWVADEDEDDGDDTGVGAVIGGGNGAVTLYNLRGQLVRKAVVTGATSLPALREDLGVSSGIYILATPEGSRKVKL